MEKFGQALVIPVVLSLFLTTTALAQGSSQPTLKIITPQENQTIYGDKIPVLLAAENFEIVDYQITPAPKSSQGHIHLWLDDANPTKESAQKIIKDTYTLMNVAYGEHTLRAELVNNNHTSPNPPQVITIKFKNAPISVPSPAASSGFDKKTALVILVVVSLVIIAAWWYTKEEDEAEKPTKPTSTTRNSTIKKKSAKKSRSR